jgi:hypothetical protein
LGEGGRTTGGRREEKNEEGTVRRREKQGRVDERVDGGERWRKEDRENGDRRKWKTHISTCIYLIHLPSLYPLSPVPSPRFTLPCSYIFVSAMVSKL